MRIMVWNIEKFTANKLRDYFHIPNSTVGRKRRGQYYNAYDRLYYMQEALSAGGAYQPDVFAVLETMDYGATPLGQPLPQAESAGVTQLLRLIKRWTQNRAWRVVPPLKCNPPRPLGHAGKWPAQEVVAVFYNSTTVSFEGPDNRVGPYPAPWNDVVIGGGTARAGRVNHVDNAGAPVLFPNNGNRRPFMVDFRERGGAQRLIRTLFIHTSPGYHDGATRAVADIRDMNPANNATANPDYYVACGDFNVNDWSIQNSTTGWNPYAPLQALNYDKQLGTANQSTHFHRKGSGPHNPAQPAPNPLGYMQQEVIDNFLVRQAAFGPAPAYTAGVVNAVDGSPAPWQTAMVSDLATINTGLSPIATFRQWQNFWCIVATSDHAPIYLNIP